MATKTRRLADFLANIDDDSRVTSAGLLDATITADDLAANSVGASELADNAVDQDAIADDAVGADQLASNAVVSASIVDANITAAKLSSTALASVEHVKPHIQPGKLYPALHGLIDGDVHHIVDSSASARSILENNKEAVNTYARGIYHSSANKNTNHALKSAIDFDGGYTTLEIDGHADFNLGSGNFTIEMWAKFHDPTEVTHTLINLWVDANNRWQLTNYGSLAFYSNIGGSSNDVSAPRTKDANWHHYAIVREGTGSNQTKLYLDGAVHAQGANALNLNFNGTKLYLGTRTDNGSDYTTFSAPLSMLSLIHI